MLSSEINALIDENTKKHRYIQVVYISVCLHGILIENLNLRYAIKSLEMPQL